MDAWFCFNCGSNRAIELHHILRRNGAEKKSALNAIPLCHRCHAYGGLHDIITIHSFDNERKFLRTTKRYLASIGYYWWQRRIDRIFYKKFKNYYGHTGAIATRTHAEATL